MSNKKTASKMTPKELEEAKAQKEEIAYLKIELDKEGRMRMDTNMSPLGAVHLMANATQIVVERNLEQPDEAKENPEQ